MSDCNHDCDSCGEKGSCEKEDLVAKLAPGASVKHVIGVVSGKGGVGKSFISSYLAVGIAAKGYKVGIMDADITGPSIPFAFGINEKAGGTEHLIYPVLTNRYKIQVMSANLLLENDSDPIVWRGPIIANLVTQFYSEVFWEEVDFLVVDMPPGTGDVPLTAFQKIKMDGIIIVASPQNLVSMIVEKAIKMAAMMNIKVLGIVENMSYVECPKCHEKIEIYGKSELETIAKNYGLEILARVPIRREISQCVDLGKIEDLLIPEMEHLLKTVIDLD